MQYAHRVIARVALKRIQRPALAEEIWVTVSPEVSERQIRESLASGNFTATMRLGDRTEETSDAKGGYAVGRSALLRIQREDGTFAPDDCLITITRTEKKVLCEITDADVARTMFTGETRAEFVRRFSAIYRRELGDREVITIVTFARGKNHEIH